MLSRPGLAGRAAPLRDRGYSAVTALWTVAFMLGGRLLRSAARLQPWTPLGGATALVVAPHPDDETIGCGGALALHRQAGERVHVVVVTDGGASGAASPAERAGELAEACRRLEVDCEPLGLPEGQWAEERGRDRLRAALDALAPARVYAPSSVDFHPEHLQVARALAAALGEARVAPEVWVYELGVPLTPVLVDRVAALGGAAARKADALAAYRSQARALAPIARLQGYAAALYGGEALEVFRALPADGYRRLIAAGPWRSHRDSPFYGVRGRPFSDPLVYLIGLRARRRLGRALAMPPGELAGTPARTGLP
jgi:LmbE family N-acetylglucosaminyl deacetylase